METSIISELSRVAAAPPPQSSNTPPRRPSFTQYDNGQTAEVSWAFIRELPPKAAGKK